MELKIKTWEELNLNEVYEILRLRGEVFVVGQNCTCVDPDGKDFDAFHLLLYEKNELIGYARLFKPGDYFPQASAIGRIAVRKPWRGRGYGKRITREAVEFLKRNFSGKPVRISAQQYLEKFYVNLGFRTVSKPYLEENMWHVKMEHA